MKKLIKKILSALHLHGFAYRIYSSFKQREEVRIWESNGRPSPPPHFIKQRILKQYATQFKLRVLIETGTYHGAMIDAIKGCFQKIYSIELADELCRQAVEKFKGYKHIEIIHGDSGVELERLMKRIHEPALFWLDGHYSGGVTALGKEVTPIFEELKHIFASAERGHVLVIDDARLFKEENSGYPTLEQLESFVKESRPDLNFAVENDCIRLTPAS
jgi:hypothetical protein